MQIVKKHNFKVNYKPEYFHYKLFNLDENGNYVRERRDVSYLPKEYQKVLKDLNDEKCSIENIPFNAMRSHLWCMPQMVHLAVLKV